MSENGIQGDGLKFEESTQGKFVMLLQLNKLKKVQFCYVPGQGDSNDWTTW